MRVVIGLSDWRCDVGIGVIGLLSRRFAFEACIREVSTLDHSRRSLVNGGFKCEVHQ